MQIIAGTNYSAYITRSGRLYLFGGDESSISVVFPVISVSVDDGDNDNELKTNTNSNDSTTVAEDNSRDQLESHNQANKITQQSKRNNPLDGDSLFEAHSKRTSIVSVPRSPSSVWFTSICTRKCVLIGGNSDRIFTVVAAPEIISDSLTAGLLNDLLSSEDDGKNSSNLYNNTFDSQNKLIADTSLDQLVYRGLGDDISKVLTDSFSDQQMYLRSRGNADCIIVTAGNVLIGHKAILSSRSPFLRELILIESSPMTYMVNKRGKQIKQVIETSRQQIVQLLLPEFNGYSKVIFYLIYFI